MKYRMTLFGVCCLLLLSVASTTAQDALDESAFYANSWAVVIGINAYQNFTPLEYAVNDAKAIETRFQSMGFNVVTFYNERATKANIMDLLKRQLPQEVSSEDRLVIFYAGHGAAGILPTGEEVGFIIPVDAQPTIDGHSLDIFGDRIQVENYETFADKTNFISVDELRDVYDSVSAKHILYIIDGCYSGFLDPAVYSRLHPSRRITQTAQPNNTARSLVIDKNPNTPPATPQDKPPTTNRPDYLHVMTSRDTVQVLTAGSSGEVVFEKSGHGVFTYYLLRALDGAADISDDPRSPVGDCVVTATELGDYLKRKVPEASNSSQIPLFNRISGEGEFLFIPPICKPINPIDQEEPTPDKNWAKTDAYQGPKGAHYKEPTLVLVDNENQVYVLDRELRRIFKFDAAGSYLSSQLEDPGIDLNKWAPSSLALGTTGEIWVYYAWQGKKPKNDPQMAGQIAVYAADGSRLQSWNGSTEPLTACDRQDGTQAIFPLHGLIAIDIEGNLVMVDQESGLMRKCDRNGKLIKEWGKYEEHKIIEDINKYKTVKNPQGMVVDLFGYIYVADTEGNGIQKYFDGEWIPSWPNVKGDKPYFFDSPHGLAVDSKAYIYVADTNNHRIKKYTSKGEKLLTYWGKKNANSGSKYGEFDEPWGVTVNGDSSLVYVADTGNKRIQKFIIRR